MPVVGIPYAPMPALQNPNIRPDADADNVYMKASFVALSSFGRWNKGWTRVLFVSQAPSEYWTELFAREGIEVVVSRFDHEAPAGFAPTFAGALFLLDAIEFLTPDDYLLLIDPDVVIVGSMERAVDPDRIAALALDHKSTDEINRLTLAGAARIHRRLGEPRSEFVHYGGEFYGIPPSLRGRLRGRINVAWSDSLRAFADDREFFTTEEHVMSFALADLPVRESSDLIRRVWTAHSHRTVTGHESELSAWHLPSEKQRSIAIAFAAAIQPGSWFWALDREAFIEKFGRLAGFHHRDPRRLLLDGAGMAVRGWRKLNGDV